MKARLQALLGIKDVTPRIGLVVANGNSVPASAAGYAVGCIFAKTNGSAGTALYVNEGTYASSTFVAIKPISTVTLDDLSDVGTIAYTAGKILVADGDSYEEVAVSSHVTMDNTGAVTLATVTKDYAIALTDLRVYATMKDALPDAPAGNGGALGLADAAGSPVIGTSTNNTDAVEHAAFDFVVPADYVAGNDLVVRISAFVSATANATSDLDIIARLIKGGALDATDLCLTTPIDIKAVTAAADHDFTIDNNASGDVLAPGSVLNIHISAQRDDTGGSTAGIAQIEAVTVRVPCYR